MRIIAGSARGIPLIVPKTVTRPTADRTREALFSILSGKLEDAQVLDLYAGSGALGLEALSRGATAAVFVEQNRTAAGVIEKNAAKAKLVERAKIKTIDVAKFLRYAQRDRFDLIFADPPYKKQESDTDHAAALLGSAGMAKMLADDGIFVLEEWSGRVLGSDSSLEELGWEQIESRNYGAASLHFFQRLAQA